MGKFPASSQVLVRIICGLGDMILTIPWLWALKELHPGSPLHLLSHADQGELLKCLGIADEAFPEEGSGWHQLFSDAQGEFPFRLRPDPGRYEHLYLFLSESGIPLASSLRKRIQGQIRILPAKPSASQALHAAFLPFRASGISLEDRFFEGLEQKPHPVKKLSFFVHPGSGSSLKNWPPENFAALMERLSSFVPRAEWTVLEGPSDKEAVEALFRFWKGSFQISRPQSLRALASSLEQGSLFLGNDSGVTHLAAFLGIPTLALFGPSDPKIWSPLGRRVRVAFQQAACEPCHLLGPGVKCQGPCRRFPSVDEAWEALLSLGPFG